MTGSILPIVWFVIIAAEVALYILLDGANLGVGLLTLLPQGQSNRNKMLDVLAPIWNANETWLLVAAGSTFGAFPAVYSIGLNALYVPAMVVAVGLITRASSFAFHDFSANKQLWSRLFGVGSLFVVIGQGFLVGGLLSGITIVDGHYGGGAFDFLTPLTGLFTVGIFSSYVVLGYSYLIKRMNYSLQGETFARILIAALVTLGALFAATFVLPKMNYIFMERWTVAPTSYLLFTIAGAIGLAALVLTYNAIFRKHPEQMYFLVLLIFALGYIGMIVGVYPYIVPPSVSIFDVASPDSTLSFMLVGIGPLLPIIFAYNWYLHIIFNKDFKTGDTSYVD